MKKIPVTIYLDENAIVKLDAIARDQMRSRSSQAKFFISEAINQTPKRQKISDMKSEFSGRANQEDPEAASPKT